MGVPKAPDAPFVRLDGSAVRTADLLSDAGGRPLLLAFFKTSCPTCRLTWPYLQRLHAAYGGKGVHVVGMSQNAGDESRRFFEERGGAAFDLVLDPEPAFRASNAFGVEAVPHLALVSPAGVLDETLAGWSNAKIEALGARLATGAGLPKVPVVPPGDPVAAFQAG